MEQPSCSALAAALALVVLGGCGTAGSRRYQYSVPVATTDGWPTGDFQDHGMDGGPIGALFDAIMDGSYVNIHAVLIIKEGTLVVEEYFPGTNGSHGDADFNRDTLHEVHSATKSVTGTLLGMAVCDGLTKDLEEPLAAFLPEYADVFRDEAKHRIRLRDLLSMTAGLEWDEWSCPLTDSRNSHIAMNNSPDPIRYVLERPLVSQPGQKFVYISGLSIVPGAVVKNVTGLRADLFAERELFAPLGITHYEWYRYPNETVQTGGGLLLRPRDMAKIGLLYENRGSWKGRQLLCENWIAESTKQQAPDAEYSYQWWLDLFLHVARPAGDGFSARGFGGQHIFVVPEQSLVAVFTGWNPGTEVWMQPQGIMTRYILPAVR